LTDDAFIESLSRAFRAGCLNTNWSSASTRPKICSQK
jgi:hypothetical protein